MNRIPVWKTIRFAYAFTFGEIGTIIGLIWLPMVAIAVLQFLPYFLGTAHPADGENPAAEGTAGLLNLVFFVAGLILYAIMYVAVTRQALGLRQGSASIHFALGRAEWRMLGARLLCALLLSATAIVLFASVGLLAFLLRSSSAAPATVAVATGLYAVGGVCAMIYVAVRLIFLVAPVVVAEEKIDLARGWSLTSDNFWRAFAVMLAVASPAVVIEAIMLRWIAGPALLAPLPSGADFTRAITNRINMFDSHMPTLIGVTLILAPFSIGLILSAASGAYRALVPQGRRT